jgi:hypothetical protein
MSDIFDNVAKLYNALRASRGEFSLFALFMPMDGDERWDLVLSAPWLGIGLEDYDSVFRAMKQTLSSGDLSLVSRIVIMRPNDPAILEFLKEPRLTLPFVALNISFGGTRIRRAHIMGLNPNATRMRTNHSSRPRSVAKAKVEAKAGP